MLVFGAMDGEGNELSEFSRKVYEKLIPKTHILYRIRERIDFSFVNEECRELYSKDHGRPAYPPEMMFKGAFIEFFWDISDRRTEEEATFDLLAKWFIGLEVDEKGFDSTELSVFRKRLGEEKFRDLFNLLLKKIQDAGFITKKQRTLADATRIEADVALPTLIGLIRHACRKTLNVLGKIDGRLTKTFDVWNRSLDERYTRPRHMRRQIFLETVDTAKEILKLANEKLEDKSVDASLKEELRESIELLLRVFKENVEEVKNAEGISYEENSKPKRIISLVDPDARSSPPLKSRKMHGYSIGMLMSENRVITNIKGFTADTYDGAPLAAMVDYQTGVLGFKPPEVVGDKQYGRSDNIRAMKERGIKLIANVREYKTKLKEGNFSFDPKRNIVTCPHGVSVNKYCIMGDGRRTFYFRKGRCKICNGTRIQIDPNYELLEGQKKLMKTKAAKKDLIIRYRIEPKFGEMKTQHGLSRARYRGLDKVNIQALMTGFVVNAKRFVRLLEENN